MSARRASQHPAWRNANFAKVWCAGLISQVGNWALFIALPVQVYGQTNSTLATALVVIANALPSVLVGQVAGVLVDRLDHRRVLVGANLGLTLVTLGFLWQPYLPWWSLAVIALVQSSVGQFLGPAEHALLPTLLPQAQLGEANSLNALNNNLARLLGPALGGWLLSVAGFGGVIVFDALTYLAAALLMLSVNAAKRGPATVIRQGGLLLEWREGMRAVRQSEPLRLVFLAVGLVGFGEGFVSTLIAPLLKEMLNGGGRELGLVLSAQAVGGLLGAWLVARFSDRIPPLRLLGWGALGSGLLLIPIFNYPLLYPVLWPALLLTAIAGLPFAAFGTAQMLALQVTSPPAMRGRIFSACFGLFGLTQLFGMGLSGTLGERWGVLVINVDAVTYLLAALVVLAARQALERKDTA